MPLSSDEFILYDGNYLTATYSSAQNVTMQHKI
jgi:hypothetical protein